MAYGPCFNPDVNDLSQFTVVSDPAVGTWYPAPQHSYCVQIDDNDGVKLAVASGATWHARVQVMCATSGGISYGHHIAFQEGSTSHVTVTINPIYGRVEVRRGTHTGTLLGTSTLFGIKNWTWYTIIVSCTVNDTTGSVTVTVDGNTYISLTNQDTRNAATGVINTIYIYNTDWTLYIGEVVTRDDAAPAYGYLETLVPNGAGTNTNWTPSTGSNWDCVNEMPPSGTDYVTRDSASPAKDTYAFTNLAAATYASISALIVNSKAKIQTAGANSYRNTILSSGSSGSGSTVSLGTSLAHIQSAFTVDPATSSAWGVSGVNAVEAGPEVV